MTHTARMLYVSVIVDRRRGAIDVKLNVVCLVVPGEVAYAKANDLASVSAPRTRVSGRSALSRDRALKYGRLHGKTVLLPEAPVDGRRG